MKFNADELLASVCMDSFFDFVKEFWSELVADEPVWNWHIEFFCDEIQKRAERVFAKQHKETDLIVNVPPGTTKSIIYSIMFPAWAFARDPATRIICGSHTDQLVLDLSERTRALVKSEKYQRLFGANSKRPDKSYFEFEAAPAPSTRAHGRGASKSRHNPNTKPKWLKKRLIPGKVVLKETQDTKSYWALTNGGFRFSCTVGGKTPTGFHAHFIIIDDPIDPQRVFSEAEITMANEWMRTVINSRKVDSRITVTFLVMQRLHQNDPTGNWLKNEATKPFTAHICLPAELSDKVSPAHLRSKYVDGLLDPVRLPVSVLTEKQAVMGQFGYSGQFRQDPVPLGGGMFKTDRFNYGIPPDNLAKVVRYWDKAATKEKTGTKTTNGPAYTAGVKMAKDALGRFWVLHVSRRRMDTFEREEHIRQTAHNDGRSVKIGIEQEGGSGGKDSAKSTIRNLAGYVIVAELPTGDKAIRADPFSVQVNSGNVWIPEGVSWVQDYLDELANFPNSTFKDQVDASSGAFRMLTKVTVLGAF